MSLLNGFSGLGSGLSAFANNALKDEETRIRTPLINSTPAVAAAEPAKDAVPDAAAVAGKPSVVAPADLLPLYQAASKRTGIPVDVLIAQAKQESNFNPDAIGSAGEIGLHQIKPSTASSPGYGLRGIDPATLKDPAVNIAFAADYLKAKAGNPNFNDPAAVDAALRAFNGGGDKNYVANVRRHMGAA
jgi:soluble lytic murein transglycosylase-like protein